MAAIGTRQTSTAGEPAQVEMILAQIESLPTLPSVATRLLELTADDGSSTRQVVQLVEADQSLSARLLAMARRADRGAQVTTVERAVVMLGFDAVRSLVLSIQIFDTFSHRVEREGAVFDREGFWKHSLAAGCASRLLAAEHPQLAVAPEEAFVCGLLHDLGKVVLDACFPKSWDRVIAAVDLTHGAITDVERKIFGLDHTLAGQRLAAHWKLPETVRECIWLHHHVPASTPTRIGHRNAVQIVQAADRLAREMRIGYSGNYSVDQTAARVAREAGISDEALQRVIAALPALIEDRAEIIGLGRLTTSEVYQEAIVGANAELARLNAELAEINRRLEQRNRCLEALTLLSARQGDEATHETVSRAAARSAGVLLPDCGVGVVCQSASRGLSVLAVAGREQDRPEIVRGLPLEEGAALIAPRAAWLHGILLPAALRDRLVAALGTAPAWCWPIRHRERLCGIFAVTGDPRVEPGESLEALSEAVGGWLGAAESTAQGRRLNEELADMNRMLVASQAQVAHMRSLAMVGEMAAGAAHELNNPLAVISGRAQLLARDEMSDDVKRSANIIAEHAHRASAIVSELMEFAKPAPPQAAAFAPAMLLNQVRRDWIDKQVLTEEQFHLALSDDVPQILADVTQSRMLFDELVRNAVESMRGSEAPRLVVNCHCDLTDDRVVISISDNGCGMSAEVLERAMDPFFSHRQAGRGRGLGLSRAARYAEINGGRIRLSSVPREGTTVIVELPAASSR